MATARRIARLVIAVLALLAPGIAAAVDPCDKNHFILTASCGFQWTAINDGLTDLDVRALAVDPVRKATLYAGSAAGVFKSVDGGAHWELTGLDMAARNAADTRAGIQRFPELNGRFTARSLVGHVAIDPSQPSTVYAATSPTGGAWYGQRRLLRSEDGGVTWSDGVSPGINGVDQINALVLAPGDPSTLYLANFDFMGDSWSPLVRSGDRGATWAYLGYPVVNVLAVDPLDSRTVYAGTFDFEPYSTDLPNGVLKSGDGGATWVATGLTGSGVTALAVDPGNSGTLYAATGDAALGNSFEGLYKSVDGGHSWVELDNDLIATTTAITAIVVDPDNSSRVYVATAGGGVSVTSDGGATWRALDNGLACPFVHSLALAAGEPNTLFAATSCGVFKAVDSRHPFERRFTPVGG